MVKLLVFQLHRDFEKINKSLCSMSQCFHHLIIIHVITSISGRHSNSSHSHLHPSTISIQQLGQINKNTTSNLNKKLKRMFTVPNNSNNTKLRPLLKSCQWLHKIIQMMHNFIHWTSRLFSTITDHAYVNTHFRRMIPQKMKNG